MLQFTFVHVADKFFRTIKLTPFEFEKNKRVRSILSDLLIPDEIN